MKSHTMTFDLDKVQVEGQESLGNVLKKAVIRMSGRYERDQARFIVEFATRAVCDAIIREGVNFPYWKLPKLLNVDLVTDYHNENDDSDGADWWKKSHGSLN
jgi:hypothetical protein